LEEIRHVSSVHRVDGGDAGEMTSHQGCHFRIGLRLVAVSFVEDVLDVNRLPALLFEMRVEDRKESRHKPFNAWIIGWQIDSLHLAIHQLEGLHLKRAIVSPCAPKQVTSFDRADSPRPLEGLHPTVEVGEFVTHFSTLAARFNQVHQWSEDNILAMV